MGAVRARRTVTSGGAVWSVKARNSLKTRCTTRSNRRPRAAAPRPSEARMAAARSFSFWVSVALRGVEREPFGPFEDHPAGETGRQDPCRRPGRARRPFWRKGRFPPAPADAGLSSRARSVMLRNCCPPGRKAGRRCFWRLT
jgi:hypothetical protein